MAVPKPVTRGGAGGLLPPARIFATPPWKNVLEIVLKIWAPLRKFFAPPGVPNWLRAWRRLMSADTPET